MFVTGDLKYHHIYLCTWIVKSILFIFIVFFTVVVLSILIVNFVITWFSCVELSVRNVNIYFHTNIVIVCASSIYRFGIFKLLLIFVLVVSTPKSIVLSFHSSMMCVTSGRGTCPFRANELTPTFSGFSITYSLIFCVVFVEYCLSAYSFSFDHCVVCSSTYGIWLLLWYLQNFSSAKILIGDIFICVHASSAVDHWFEPRSGLA